MAGPLTRPDRTLILAGGVVLALIVGVTLVFSAGEDTTSDVPSSHSTASGGGMAAYLLLQASGYKVSRWEQSPSALSEPSTTTLILAEPSEPPSPAERASILRFLEAGGRVIATGLAGAVFVNGSASPAPVEDFGWKQATAAAPSPLSNVAPEITLAIAAVWSPDIAATALYASPAGQIVVAHMRVGLGDAMWWAAATPLSNAGLTERGNLEFFLASLGPPAGRRVLWDEYFHGDRQSITGTILHSSAKWLLTQFAIVALAIAATYVRRSGPVLPLPTPSRLSPLEFVRTIGALYERAHATPLVLEAAEDRARDRIARRFGLPVRSTIDQIERAAAGLASAGVAAIGGALRTVERTRTQTPLAAQTVLPVVQALADAVTAVDPPSPRWSKEQL
jgi:hypothetical protein